MLGAQRRHRLEEQRGQVPFGVDVLEPPAPVDALEEYQLPPADFRTNGSMSGSTGARSNLAMLVPPGFLDLTTRVAKPTPIMSHPAEQAKSQE